MVNISWLMLAVHGSWLNAHGSWPMAWPRAPDQDWGRALVWPNSHPSRTMGNEKSSIELITRLGPIAVPRCFPSVYMLYNKIVIAWPLAKELAHFAEERRDFDTVVVHRVSRGDYATAIKNLEKFQAQCCVQAL